MFEKYIDNKPLNGLKIDYKKVNKEFDKMMKKCNAPAGLYDPTTLPLNDANWFVLMSERSSSKTTQCLLYALLIYKLYGVNFCYVRQRKNNITKSMYVKLFNVINDPTFNYCGYLTDGQYNHLGVTTTKDVYFYDAEEKQASEPVGVLMDIEEYDRYCSTFNTTKHDIIIFDEFSWGKYMQDEFVHFCQLIATIRRERISVKIIMLSNTISPYNQYLQELGISTQLAKMKKGQHAVITSQLGTKVYCALLDVEMHKTKEFDRKALSYFGFANESLRALYGGEWEIKGFKHLPTSKTREMEKSDIILSYLGYTMRLCYFEDGEMYGVFIQRFTGEKEKYNVVSEDTEYQTDYFNTSSRRLADTLRAFNTQGRLYVSDNETGLAFFGLIDAILQKR